MDNKSYVALDNLNIFYKSQEIIIFIWVGLISKYLIKGHKTV